MFLQRVMATMLALLVLAMLLLLLNLVNGEDIHKRPDHAASRQRRDPDGTMDSKTDMVPGNIDGHEETAGQGDAKQCRKPYRAHLSLEPPQEWYDPEVTVKVMCSPGYQASMPEITCKKTSLNSEVQWSEKATCIPQCANPSTWDARVSFYNNKQWYNQQETVQVRCSNWHLPSAPHITCKKKSWSSRSEWNLKVTCIYIKGESWQKTADTINLQVTCDGRNCQTFWTTSVAAQPATTICPGPGKVPQCKIEDKRWVEESVTCTSLQPFTWYTVTVYGTYRIHPQTTINLYRARFRTDATAPDAPEPDGMMGMMGKEEDGTIRWKKLSDCKGTIEAYQLNITSWREYNKTFVEEKHVTVNSSATEYTVTSPGTNYTVTVQGFNEAGLGAASSWTFVTKIKAPILPPIINTNEYNASATVNTFALPLHPVPDLHGPISEYQIIVSRQGHSSDDICRMGDLEPYNKSLEQDAYIAAALPAHNLTREFVVGDGTTQHGHYNAPLSTDYNYTAFLRVISIWNQEKTQSCAQYGSTFTERCKKPITQDPYLRLIPSKEWYDLKDTVTVTCSRGYQPSSSMIACLENYPGSESGWNVPVSCIHIEEESLQITADSISLTVTCDGGNCQKFWRTSVTVQPATPCCGSGCPTDKEPQCTIENQRGKETATCTSLQPFTWYTVTIYGTYQANPQSSITLHRARVRTKATAPDAPELETANTENGPIRWKKLSDCKGTIEGYQLNITSWGDNNKTFLENYFATVNSSATEYTVRSSWTNYTVTIRGFNEAGLGAASSWAFAPKIQDTYSSFSIFNGFQLSQIGILLLSSFVIHLFCRHDNEKN